MQPLNGMAAKMSPTATKMIRMDHAHALALFHKLEPGLAAGTREATIRSLCAALEIHAQLEEELFYPALRDNGVQSDALDKAVPEHAGMRSLIARVRSLEGQRAAQDDAVNELVAALLHHVADEETRLLPAAERFVGAERLAALGAQMTRRRIALARPRAGELAADAVRAAPMTSALVAVGALLAGTALVAGWRHRNGHAQRLPARR